MGIDPRSDEFDTASSHSIPLSLNDDKQQSDTISNRIQSQLSQESSTIKHEQNSHLQFLHQNNTILPTTTQPQILTTIDEHYNMNKGRDDDQIPAFENYSPPADQLPVAEIVHFNSEEVDGNSQAIINLQKEIEQYNQDILGKTEQSSKKGSILLSGFGNMDDNTCDTAVTSSSSDSTACPLNRRSFKSEPLDLFEEATTICNEDESLGGMREEYKIQSNDAVTGDDHSTLNDPIKAKRVQPIKRLETSRSVSKQSTVGLSFFRRKFQSLTFRRKSDKFLSLNSNVNPQFTSQIKGSYKKTSAQAIVAAIQLGIAYSVGKFSAKPDRDVLLQDFFQVEEVYFPSCGTTYTPSHRFADFTMSDYSPVAFRYFRDIFSISPEDFMTSLSTRPLRQLSNPGASGSMFFVSEDDIFIIKTVDKREAKFLQQLLPGYYMNLHQNPKTLLPKFFGLYSYKYSGRNIRLVVMNNLMPSRLQFHEKYDLKGSTFKRKASQKERSKLLPTLKDLDFIENHPDGFELSHENHQRLLKTLQRDVRVLQSYKIMDYSLLLCVHNKVIYEKNKLEHYRKLQANLTKSTDITIDAQSGPTSNTADDETVVKSTNASLQPLNDGSNDNSFDIDEFLKNGIPAKNSLGEDLILFVGIIDILQNYRLIKRTEHNLKAMVHDRDSISVHNPVFYAERFLSFCSNIFRVVNKPISKENSPTRPSTNKSPQKIINAVSSTSQPILSINNPDNSNPPINHHNRNVNKYVAHVLISPFTKFNSNVVGFNGPSETIQIQYTASKT